MTQDDLCDCRVVHMDRIRAAKKSCLSLDEIEEVSQTFKAFGDVSRLKILCALEGGDMCVCDLAAFLGISESAVSHQLRLLRTMRLVRNRREGPIIYYQLADKHIGRLIKIALEHVRE